MGAVGSTYIAKRKEKEAVFVVFGELLKAGDLIFIPVIAFELCSNESLSILENYSPNHEYDVPSLYCCQEKPVSLYIW